MFSPFRVIIIFVILSMVGLALVPKLSVDLQPNTSQNSFQITFSLPNATPEIVESSVTSILENTFSRLSDVEKISSVSRYNAGTITILLSKNAKKAFKKMEISALIRQIYPKLPQNTSFPVIFERGAEDKTKMPLLVYSIIAPYSSLAIRNTAENIFKRSISVNQAIEKVEITGANEEEIVIEYDLQKLQTYQISKNQLKEIVEKHSQERFLGVFESAVGERFFVKTENKFKDLADFENIIIKTPTNTSLRLHNLARVYVSEQEPQSYFRINGLNSVRMAISSRKNANNLALSNEIKIKIETLHKQLPSGYGAVLEYDSTKQIQQELDKIYTRTGFSVLILMVFILLTSLNFSYLFILMTGVVVNLCLTAILTYIFNIQLHLYSLAGLTISFGMIVDNAVVMLDHLKKKGDKKVFLALLGATLTTLAALALVFLLPEEDRLNLSDFSLIIVINLAVSLLVALFFTPALYEITNSKFTKITTQQSSKKVLGLVRLRFFYYHFISKIARFRKTFNLALVLLFGTPFFLLPNKIDGFGVYNAVFENEFFQENIRPYLNIAFGGTLRLFVNNVYENSGYRSPERDKLYVSAEMPYGTTLTQMNEIITKVEKYLKTVNGVDKFVSEVYSGTDASINISFLEGYEALPYELKTRLIAQSIDWGGVGWSIYGVGDGFSNKQYDQMTNFRLEMRGYNYLELEQQARIFAKKLEAHERIQTVNINEKLNYNEKKTQEYVFSVDNLALQTLGIAPTALSQALDARGKAENTDFYVFKDNLQMPVKLRETNSNHFSAFEANNEIISLQTRGTSTKSLMMRNVGTLQLTTTSAAIYKENRQYIRLLAFDYFGGEKFGQEYLDKKTIEMKQEMPAGYLIKQAQYRFDREKAKRQYGLLVVLAVAIFVICSILLENFWQPFLILLQIPLSLVGVFLAFALGNFYFDQGGYAAFVLLGGLVVNSAIFVVNDYNQFKQTKGIYQTNKNIIKAVLQKAMPIFLSIFSTILGLVPFMMEGDKEVFWFSLAIGTTGGLLMSIFGVFVALPVWMWKKK